MDGNFAANSKKELKTYYDLAKIIKKPYRQNQKNRIVLFKVLLLNSHIYLARRFHYLLFF